MEQGSESRRSRPMQALAAVNDQLATACTGSLVTA